MNNKTNSGFCVCLVALVFLGLSFALGSSVQSQTPSDSVVSDSVVVAISYDEGPHVYWRDDSTAMVLYFVEKKFERYELSYPSGLKFEGFHWDDTVSYVLHPQENVVEPGIIDGASRILALSDIHGEYEYFVEFLQTFKVIDSARHWIWGDGHLVICGDIFDRGDKVTEIQWLVYMLEAEAASAGGAVHYLLGNHELMPLRGDYRYVNEKYLEGISRRYRISYMELYGAQMEFGRWLRSKNTLLRLNDILFLHGGVSTALIDSAYSIDEINARMRGIIDMDSPELLFNGRSKFLTSSLGPIWYRGYHYAMEGRYPQASSAQIDSLLEYFGCKAIVVGHTGVDSVSSLYDGRVFAVDIPFEDIYAFEGLYWDSSGFYRVDKGGVLIPFE